MTADIIDLDEYRARRRREERYDALVADLKAGVVFVHPHHSMTESLVGLLRPSRRSDDRVDALRYALGPLWSHPVDPDDYRRDLRSLAERWFPHGYEVERPTLRLVPPARMTPKRRRVRAARRRRRLLRGY